LEEVPVREELAAVARSDPDDAVNHLVRHDFLEEVLVCGAISPPDGELPASVRCLSPLLVGFGPYLEGDLRAAPREHLSIQAVEPILEPAEGHRGAHRRNRLAIPKVRARRLRRLSWFLTRPPLMRSSRYRARRSWSFSRLPLAARTRAGPRP